MKTFNETPSKEVKNRILNFIESEKKTRLHNSNSLLDSVRWYFSINENIYKVSVFSIAISFILFWMSFNLDNNSNQSASTILTTDITIVEKQLDVLNQLTTIEDETN